MNRFFQIASVALLAVLGAAAQPILVKPASWLDPDKSEPAGTHYRTIKSGLAGGEVSFLIYLPPDYEAQANRRYPVVYWLHGVNGGQTSGMNFVKQLDIALRTGRGAPAMIVVMVNGMRDSFYCDSPDGKWPIESIIVKELIPHIDRSFRTIAEREARGVEGFSMGGYGAAHLAFKYPDLFGIAGIMAGGFTDTDNLSQRMAPTYLKMFGSDKAYFEANDPFTLVRKNADAIRGKMAIRLAVGDQDELKARVYPMHQLLDELKIEHQWEVVPGVGHNPALFYSLLAERPFVSFYGKVWNVPGGLGR
jgi:endo-1,4-beta-xylanase